MFGKIDIFLSMLNERLNLFAVGIENEVTRVRDGRIYVDFHVGLPLAFTFAGTEHGVSTPRPLPQSRMITGVA